MKAVLKIGGSAITKKSGFMREDNRAIAGVARAVASALRKQPSLQLIVVHGAGSFGHPHVVKHGINKGVGTREQKKGFALTHHSVAGLSHILVQALLKQGVPAITLPPVAFVQQDNKRIARFYSENIKALLQLGFVPVLHGDVVPDAAIGGSVVSGDQLVSFLGNEADVVVLASDVDGIFDSDPKKNKRAKLLRCITRENLGSALERVGSSIYADVTGGMRGKLEEIARIHAPVFVVNARKPERITAALLGKKTVGTEIRL